MTPKPPRSRDDYLPPLRGPSPALTSKRPCAIHDVLDCGMCAIAKKNLVRVLNELRANLAAGAAIMGCSSASFARVHADDDTRPLRCREA